MSAMAPEGGLEVIDLTDLVGDLEIPCDWGTFKGYTHGPARWVVRRVPCTCGYTATKLICDECKEAVMGPGSETVGCECSGCGTYVIPFRKTIAHIEALNRRAA